MTIFLWILIIVLFLLSFVGLIFPLIPSVLVLWGGFLLYAFGIDRFELSVWFWVGASVLTIFILISDVIAGQYFVKKYGGSKWGERIAVIGVILGSFIYPPFGIIIVPFALVFITEYMVVRNLKHAALVSVASLLAFLSSTFAKFIVQLIMICWFSLEVFI